MAFETVADNRDSFYPFKSPTGKNELMPHFQHRGKCLLELEGFKTCHSHVLLQINGKTEGQSRQLRGHEQRSGSMRASGLQ